MIDIKIFRENPEIVKKDLKKRGDKEKLKWVDDVVKKDKEWRKLKFDLQKLVHSRNTINQEINALKKQGKDISKKIKELKNLPKKIEEYEAKLKKLEQEITHYLLRIPNLMDKSVPVGKDDTQNKEVRKWGKPKKFSFDVKHHVELVENLDIADFERSSKVAGSGFYYLKGGLALLNQALIRFAIDHLVKKKYTYVEPPLMIRKRVMEGVTDYEFFEKMIYKTEGEDLYPIATSEHPLVAMHMNETIDDDNLPVKLVGYSPCFRKEIGSHGIDEKGLFRTHQFNKVEQVIFCSPEDSSKLHEELVKNSEELLKELEIPYRVVNVCTGDLGIIASKKYDVEAWMPHQKAYREVCSASNCTDYQARRLNIKFGKEGGKKQLVHTLNNTAIATSRVMVAIIENYQNKDGTITIPKALQKYCGLKVIK